MSFSEGALEEILAKHSILIEESLVLLGRQVTVGRIRVDLLFKDRFGDTLIVEVKKGSIKRQHVAQIMDYAGTLYDGKPVRRMLIGNRVPTSWQHSLEYHGIEWREISEEKLLLFLEENDKDLLEKLRIEKPPTIRIKSPLKKSSSSPASAIVDLSKTFQDFKGIKHFVAGEGINEVSLETWHQVRVNAKGKYAILFSQPQLKNLTREDFESFLYYRNNRSWTNLYRRGREAARKIGDLKKAIAHIQNESVDIRVRINSVLRGGSYHVKGMGKNLATAILHVCDKQDRYGVWNNRTEGGLQKLGRLPRRTYNYGEFYYRINGELNRLKKELNTDLIIVDSFMWYVDKYR